MKRLAAVFSMLLSAFALDICAFAESESSLAESAGTEFSTGTVVIAAAAMFAVIAVIGVMFAKVIQKDRNDIRGIRRK